MGNSSLADDVPPTLNHAVGGPRPGIGEHPVVAVIDIQPGFQFGGGVLPGCGAWVGVHGKSSVK
jgi:hypothetical protein